jgi:hypothetical protein
MSFSLLSGRRFADSPLKFPAVDPTIASAVPVRFLAEIRPFQREKAANICRRMKSLPDFMVKAARACRHDSDFITSKR